jgi:hypothetical protein
MRFLLAAAVVLVFGVAHEAGTLQARQGSALDRPVAATHVWCEPGPGPECLWQLASQLDWPVGLQYADVRRGDVAPATSFRFEVPATTVRALLTQFVRDNPQYEWRVVDDIGVVRPRAAWDDEKDVLNQRAEAFDLPSVTLGEGALYLGKVGGFKGMASRQNQPIEKDEPARCAIHFGGGSVLQAVNAVARAFGDSAWKVEPMRERSKVLVFGQVVSTRDEIVQTLSIFGPRAGTAGR